MSKIDSVIAEVESALQKLGNVQNMLKEIKDDAEAIEKARADLRRPKVGKIPRPPS